MDDIDNKFPVSIIAVCFAISLMLFAFPVSAADVTRTVWADDTANPMEIKAPSHLVYNEDATCNIDISGRFTGQAASPYSLSYTFYAPGGTIKGSGAKSDITNVSCLNLFGFSNIEVTNQSRFESRLDITHGATSTQRGYIKSILECDINSVEKDITIGSNGEKDHAGNNPNWYGKVYSGIITASWTVSLDSIKNDIFNNYPDFDDSTRNGCPDISFLGTSREASYPNDNNEYDCQLEITTFNSGERGTAEVKVNAPSATVSGINSDSMVYIMYFPLDSTSEAVTLRDSGRIDQNGAFTATSINENITLTSNRDYALASLYCSVNPSGTTETFTFDHSRTNLTYSAYEPEYVCGEWSECVDSVRSRECTDPLGIALDTVQEEDCFPFPVEEFDLGFESFYEKDVYLCQKDWWLVTCADRIDTIQQKYPTGWIPPTTFTATTNVEIANFLRIVPDESAPTGSKSLQMWYIPPKNDEPIFTDVGIVCGNSSFGRNPLLSSPFNESLFISTNITFDNPNVQIRYSVRDCSEPVLQYDYTGDFFNPCGKKCYSSDCDIKPEGNYQIILSEPILVNVSAVDYNFTFFDENDVNRNSEISKIDGTTAIITIDDGKTPEINVSNSTINNLTTVRFFMRVNDAADIGRTIYITDITETKIYAAFNTRMDTVNFYWYNITLSGVGSGITRILLSDQGAGGDFDLVVDRVTIGEDEYSFINDLDILGTINGEAEESWNNEIIDLSNVNLTPGKNYFISLAADPEHALDPNSYCFYMDDFRVSFTETALPSCESSCEGFNLKLAREQGEACLFSIIENSPECAPDEDTAEAMQNRQPFCVNGNYTFFSNETFGWEILQDSDLCDVIVDDVTDPEAVATGTEILNEAVNALFIRSVIALIITAVAIVISAWKTEKWEVGAFVGLIAIILFTIIEWLDPVYAFMIGAGIAGMIALLIKKSV